MIKTQQTGQAGSAVVFVIVGVVLTIALVAGIAFVRNQFSQSGASTQTGTVAVSNGDDASDSQNQSQFEGEDAKRQSAEEARRKAQAEADQKAKLEAEEAKKRDQQQAAASISAPTGSGQTAASGELPTTGPLEDIFMMAVGAVAIFTAGYVYYHYGRN